MYQVDTNTRHAVNKNEYTGYDALRRSFQPQVYYNDDKGKNVKALRDEIENVYTQGMSRLMDDNEMEY